MTTKISEYTFTGYYPCGNPFKILYDEHKGVMFCNSVSVSMWDKEPKRGDKIKIETNGRHQKTRVWINGNLVYTKSDSSEKELQSKHDSLTMQIKKDKGLI